MGETRHKGILIIGGAAFTRATIRAIDLASRTSGWEHASKISVIRETEAFSRHGGGFISGGQFSVFPGSWQSGDHWYAGMLAHEGAHIAFGAGTEGERKAFGVQRQTLTELGCRRYDRFLRQHEANPTHHIAFAEDYARHHGQAAAAAVAQTRADSVLASQRMQEEAVDAWARAMQAKADGRPGV